MIDLDRRGVMLAGGGALAAAALGTAAWAAPQRKLGYAIVGLGSYGLGVIIPQFKHCRDSKLVALVSGDAAKARRVAAEYGVPERNLYNYQDFDSIRDNPDIDIVYVCLPVSMHAEYTIRAAQAGKHVLCEKPMALSAAECEAMIAACAKAGRKLMIGYRCHFEPTNLEAIRRARAGEIGKLRYFRSEHGFVQRNAAGWRLQKAMSGGGSLMDMGIYALQAARYMTGEEPVAVYATERTDRSDPRFREVEDMIEFELEFPSGVLASCMSMYSANQNHILLMGDKGRIELEPGTGYAGNRLWVGQGRGSEITPAPGPGATQWAGQLDHLAQCVLTNRTPIVPGEEGLRDLRIIEAIYQSARERRRLVLRT
ncbi:Gfo/Idh/MocA family protein [Pseudoduganella chitinolytica]|uniref:Gfo/Idh/MocA family oxidoreductase n=1 Tax=Pseudoduganella chitinolytica TaxID=34070 RepID=A0ABY8B939_9BURK|nr:Gfo/Idh/MocA family oxidoreductase [Pseudoduganella chitinolytica]WEF31498.1 Gfo/Idh/MocA family oxidoreductase [Pseudoduganella chitinolytica]